MRVRAASSPQAKSRVMRRRPRHSVEFKMMVVRAALRRIRLFAPEAAGNHSPAPEKGDDTEYESDDPSELSYFNQTDTSAASASSEAPVLAPFVYHTPPPGPIAPPLFPMTSTLGQ